MVAQIKLFILIFYKIVNAFNEKIKTCVLNELWGIEKVTVHRACLPSSRLFHLSCWVQQVHVTWPGGKKKKKDLFRRFQQGEHHFSFDGKQRENATIAKELPKPLPDCVQPAFTAVSSPLQSKGNVPNTRFSFPLRFPDVKIRFTFYGNVATQWSGSTFVCKRNKCQNSSTPVKNLCFPFGLTIWYTVLI